jgi:voltage-gated potassium channel
VTPLRRVQLGLSFLAVVLIIGTAGFVIISDASIFDSFYMVVTTITTVGFGEVFEMNEAARAWALVLIAVGFGVSFYTAGAAIEYLIDLSEVRRGIRMQRQIDGLAGHIVLCGFGRVGRATHANLAGSGYDVVVIEQDPDQTERAERGGALVVIGDATHNETLIAAGVERANALIACVDTDSDNLVIALSAKSLRPDLKVICRATEPESERKLRLAGADGVVAPQAVGAERLAALAVHPELSQIFDVVVNGRPVEFHVEEIDVAPGCVVEGKTIAESGIRQGSGATILAVEAQKVNMVMNPDPDMVLHAGDRLVMVGSKEQVETAARLLTPAS